MVCVRKPNLLAYRGGVRKPGDFAGRVQEGPAGLGLRTKTEFIGLQGKRTQTGRLCRPGSGGDGRPWFAYENRIHWLSREAYANRETLPAGFKRVRAALVCVRKPNSLAFRGGVRKPCRQQPGPGPPFSLFSAWWFAYENRIHWLCGQAYANRGSPAGFRRGRPDFKNQKTLNRPTETSADSKFFHYILHPIYKEETYSFSPRAKRRMVRPTPSSSLLSAT